LNAEKGCLIKTRLACDYDLATDGQVIASDWQAVGNDLRVAGSFVFGELIDERPIVQTIQTNSTAPLMNEKPNPHRGSDFGDFL